jgi:8-oxo-dGTP pyrophosphatase MutT (NUDIX family)
MRTEVSCGIIVFDGDKVLLIKHNGGHTSFPKGHVEKGENFEVTAVRETEEETLHKCRIIKEIFVNKYTSTNDEKYKGQEIEVHNHIFLAIDEGEVTRDIKEEDKEISKWFKISDVENNISFHDLKVMWNKCKVMLEEYLSTNK